MILDGSFSCHAALCRLFARCPALRSEPRFLSLERKGGGLVEDDVVAALAEPLLHPSYTIPVVGCFRPLCRRIVGRAVASLRSVPSLQSESGTVMEEIGDEDTRVIDFYVGRGRGLRLHELASLAFSRVLDLAPFLLGCIMNYFKFSPPPFGRLIYEGLPSPVTEKSVKLLLDATRVSYRLLVMEPKVFSDLWDWSCFLDLMLRISDLGLVAATMSNDELDLRWCTVQILSLVLKASDRATESFGLGADEDFTCLLRWEEYCMDTSLEKAGSYLQIGGGAGRFLDGTTVTAPEMSSPDCDSWVDSLSDLDITESKRKQHKINILQPFILTTTVKRSFEVALMAVSQRWPVLLYGPVGTGKTALINRLAQISRNEVLFIHMDEQMDARTLIGSYICTEQPGEFKWHPGSLTQAILNGFWIVFEDIDKAPNDVQSILLPLLEGSGSFPTGHGEAVEVSESFRLFATITITDHENYHAMEGRLSFSLLWRRVMVGTPSQADMLDIVNAWFPSLQPVSSKIIDVFERVNTLVSNNLGGIHGVGSVLASAFSRYSLRDLIKWCKRIAGSGLDLSGTGSATSACQSIYQEAVDIFAASLPSLEKRLLIMKEVAKLFGVPLYGTDYTQITGKPTIQTRRTDIQVGRVILQCVQKPILEQQRPFVSIRSSLHVLEMVACSVKFNEPVLLVGETGTGKTTLVQKLAMWLGQPLAVMNLSQQSDVGDLLGGFKPTDARSICIPLYHEFKDLFCKTFSGKNNEALLRYCEVYAMEKNWRKLLRAFQKCIEKVQKHIDDRAKICSGSKRKRPLSAEIISDWESFSLRTKNAHNQIGATSGMLFRFVEGALITALRSGHWILLDEVNLAPPETLQRIGAVLDGERGTLCLAERGDVDCVYRHPCFRIFACMNPATDTGKRELPYSFRSRFTEYFVDDILDDDDLHLFVNKYLEHMHTSQEMTGRIVRFYKAAKKESEVRLQDGANQMPQFSLRSLARALEYAKKAEKTFGFKKALYDGFAMFFLTLLDAPSAKIMNSLILLYLLDGSMPPSIPFDAYFERALNYKNAPESYIITSSIEEHLKKLSRAVYIRKYPVLLQGPTSSGKTSLVHFLASVTGHECVRINNHEHTDLQEYFGSYVADSHGRLQFQEGALVKAVRGGHWIILDELNLAPSDVLEALNRLLDDNRELFVPELQETIPAHTDFMLFATQNPPMFYGGRKMLSRAFRNRFVEMHVDEIPENELITILERRCEVPRSYAFKMVEVMKDLQLHRQNSRVFAGKHGFITPRDLFRWANRFRVLGKSYEDLARDGYLLLAERLRDENEKIVVQETLQRHLRVKLDVENLYAQGDASQLADDPRLRESFGNITWTKSMWRLYFLVERCYKLREPVLLIGETGGGKTTVCQVLSAVLGASLHILNCHQYTETSDFIGGFCPIRDRSRIATEFKHHITMVKQSKLYLSYAGDAALSFDISESSSTIDQLHQIISSCRNNTTQHPDVSQQDVAMVEQVILELMQLQQQWQTIFHWQDGPLVQAMRNGDLLLIDEISLADDSVLERLNSVLETERTLTLVEKGGSVLEKIMAHPNFWVIATMNPGGDYGKKELSPALRNRFTEIWVPAVGDVNELKCIAMERFAKPELSLFADCIISFWQWFNQMQTGRILTIRDLLSWIQFVNVTERNLGSACALIHGVFLVLLDGLSLGTGVSRTDAQKIRESSLSFLFEELHRKIDSKIFDSGLKRMDTYGWGGELKNTNTVLSDLVKSADLFGIQPFYIAKGEFPCEDKGYEFQAPTTSRNLLRVLRAMQLSKPVLLEGSPGVGKTSLIVALAKYSGHAVVRINLSEQTDMMDLLGSDLPVQGESGMEFSWSDGILLQALRKGSWVLLDELNLAPQSVLEGLNAILDHRAEVYIPELGQTFKCPSSFRIFACQNPSSQGGGRKGLPKSFLNRFTKVYVDELSANDYYFICRSHYPSIPSDLLLKLISFNEHLHIDTMIYRKYGQEGSPWEFNLRDVIRSCQMIEGSPENSKVDCFLNTVYLQRMRTPTDRCEVVKLFEEVFQLKPRLNHNLKLYINPHNLILGSACVQRSHFQPSKVWNNQISILPGTLHSLEAAMRCVQEGWLCILVGPHSSGKTSVIRLLAQLTGNALNELNLSSATDVSELLGCFEQYNFFRHFKAVVSQVERYVDEYFSLGSEMNWKNLVSKSKGLFVKWFEFMAAKKSSSVMPASAFVDKWEDGSFSLLTLLIDIIKKLKHDLELYCLPVSWSNADLQRTLMAASKLKHDKSFQEPVKFEWVAGALIKAMECGEWIVLDNANLCNPTVLDRINSLVEPEGFITINECGLIDGNPVMFRAHPQFRMFLTVNPKHGEVSRAMRNRGVEIFMCEQNYVLDQGSPNSQDNERNDVIRFLISCGIPSKELVFSMSEAHMYAKAAGSHLGIRITLLEVVRWVQLFQQLLMKGNQLMWSLQLSWEHTYLPSLGEVNGISTVMEGKFKYLVDIDTTAEELPSEWCFPLPGKLPMPQKLRNFIWYSKEACIKRNCMYLESLGAQCAAYQASKSSRGTLLGKKSVDIHPSVMPLDIMHLKLSSCQLSAEYYNKAAEFDFKQANNMLFIAANWAVEQATEKDLALYAIWFKWYDSQLQPYCEFFSSFGTMLEQEMCHPIWQCILECYRELISNHRIDVNVHPIPLLSVMLVDLARSNAALRSCKKRLNNAFHSVSLLRITYHQWNSELNFPYDENLQNLVLPLLKSLGCLESEVLKDIVKSRKLLQTYSSLLDYHRLLWNSITLSQFEYLPVIWNLLKKEVIKLQRRFHQEVHAVLMDSLNLNNLPAFNIQMQKPTLWVCGGHPLLPSSVNIFYKLKEFFSLIARVWPRRMLWKQNFNDGNLLGCILATNRELRWLAMEGASMSILAASEVEKDDSKIVAQLEDICQVLLRKHESQWKKLELLFKSTEGRRVLNIGATACCSVSSEILCTSCGFNGWLATVPLLNLKSFNLDLILLEQLVKCAWIDTRLLHQAISDTSFLLEHSLDYSLKLSSRSPIEFVPHQLMLWIQRAWDSVDSCNLRERIASCILEMWYNSHNFLWTYCSEVPESLVKVSCSKPRHLIHLTKTTTISSILQDTLYVKDFEMNCLKLRVASRNLWEDYFLSGNLLDSLHSLADSIFKQMLLIHRKHFQLDTFNKMQSILCGLSENGLAKEELDDLMLLISSTSHGTLASLSDSLIGTLLKELYLKCSSDESFYNLGCAWLHIGMLRFNLLLSSYGTDPAAKYAIKHSLILEKISLLKLEFKVRHDCEQLAGCSSANGGDQRLSQLQKLEAEETQLRAKIVFRPQPSKHQKLRSACAEFREHVSLCTKLALDLKCNENLPLVLDRASSWQITAANFIKRLSEEFSEYIDLIQPVQVAVYEMKFGLSIVISCALESEFLKKVEENDNGSIVAAICSLMQFPVESVADRFPIQLKDIKPKLPVDDQKKSEGFLCGHVDLLKKLLAVSNAISLDKMVSEASSIYHICLMHIARHVCCSLVMDKEYFSCLRDIFLHFTSLWIDMKQQWKTKEDEAQYYKFRPRLIRINDILEANIIPFPELDSDGVMALDSEENFEQEFMKEPIEVDESSKELWDLIPEPTLNFVVQIHNQIFGSSNFADLPGTCHITDEQKLHTFMRSYGLGIRLMKDLQVTTLNLDGNLLPEHMLRLCLEYEQTSSIHGKRSNSYNIYKDPNPSVLFNMVEPVVALQDRVKYFLHDFPDHPGLVRILEITDSLLAMPLDSPLSKALLGLQLLLGRTQSLQENDSRYSFRDELQPFFVLVSAWQKMELDCWHVLLDAVQKHYETNAGLLWFPLRAVIYRNYAGDAKADNFYTIKSIDEFIQTSSVGEFKRRLHLVLAFHGELSYGVSLEAYSSPDMSENVNILYNAFGYYLQFMPLVLEHIETARSGIEKDIKELLKLYRWEQHPHDYSSLETFKRTRQKILKLVQKFNDVLQQPVLVVLNEAVTGSKVPSWLDSKMSSQTTMDVLQFPIDLVKLRDRERFPWYGEWRSKAHSAFQSMCIGSASGPDFLQSRGFEGIRREFLHYKSAQTDFVIEWDNCCSSLEKICINAAELSHVWKHGTKNHKRRALATLMKTLEGCGLLKHRPINYELVHEMDHLRSSYLQPSYDMVHLLGEDWCHRSSEDISANVPAHSNAPSESVSANVPAHSNAPSESEVIHDWQSANRSYFKCLAVMQQLQQICLKFNKDLDLEQVNRAASFMDHLITVLCEQRSVLYNVYRQLAVLRKQFCLLGIRGEGCCLSSKQHALLKCMWQQKQLFDNLVAMSKDVRLLLGSIEDCHLSSCDIVSGEAAAMSSLLDKFVPKFLNSKVLLDRHLIGSNRIVAAPFEHLPLSTKDMELFMAENFRMVNTFKENIMSFDMQKMRPVKQALLRRFEGLISKGRMSMEDFYTIPEEAFQHQRNSASPPKLEAVYAETFDEAIKLITDVMRKLDVFSKDHGRNRDISAGNITLWKDLLDSYVEELHIDRITDAISKIIVYARNQVDSSSTNKIEVLHFLEIHLMHLHVLLDLLLTYVEGILSEFLEAHITISRMTQALGHLFIILFTEGFGAVEEPAENIASGGTQDATGTGMGEGEGICDVSNQIDDEEQLLGSSQKQDGPDQPNQLPSDKDKGIEMDADFTGDTFSISEESGDGDSQDGEEMNLESQMGEAGDGADVVGEKAWDEDEHDNPQTSAEKYESGQSVKEMDTSSLELRAKEDNALGAEESQEINNAPVDEAKHEDDDGSPLEDEKNTNGMVMDKSDAFEDPTGSQFQEMEKDLEDTNMDETEGSDMLDEPGQDVNGSDEEMMEDGEPDHPDHVEEQNATQDEEENNAKDTGEHGDTANTESHAETHESDKIESSVLPSQGIPITDHTGMVSKMESEPSWANSSEMSSAIAPSINMLSDKVPELDVLMPDSSYGSKLTANSKPETMQNDASSLQLKKTNPFRSIGNAMEEWKERAKVVADPQDHQSEAPDIENENADEYRYVSEGEKSTSQALGGAALDQLNNDVEASRCTTDDNRVMKRKETDRTDVMEHSEVPHLHASHSLAPSAKIEEEVPHQPVDTNSLIEELQHDDTDQTAVVVEFKRSFMSEKVVPIDIVMEEKETFDVIDLKKTNVDMRRAIVDWKRHELMTTRLSQELAEQLRLVLEPTLASKLQGDYRTGKRINMKKVIPYIASHFRKDKIWLRRTKPNKRNYQVVVAVDDSRSMSEAHCGKVAVEALVTVCQAMSQLEVGEFAVASFGEKGKIKLLHDFDQPFNGEAGIKMISNLSFDQDNTIADEPVVDLLKYLNNMLDTAAAKSHIPSGQNPLHQLILIIADGRFHEKENLHRCVRDFLNKRRMIAFILLDSHQESIMDLKEASFEGNKLSLTRYLNSFPFPYYIVLKNIGALPRTLADLLRQWFELMQSFNE